jgi:hypothetical protein
VPHAAFNGRRPGAAARHAALRLDDPRIIYYSLAVSNADRRTHRPGRGRTSPLTNTTNPLFHPRKPLRRGAFLCAGSPAAQGGYHRTPGFGLRPHEERTGGRVLHRVELTLTLLSKA